MIDDDQIHALALKVIWATKTVMCFNWSGAQASRNRHTNRSGKSRSRYYRAPDSQQ